MRTLPECIHSTNENSPRMHSKHWCELSQNAFTVLMRTLPECIHSTDENSPRMHAQYWWEISQNAFTVLMRTLPECKQTEFISFKLEKGNKSTARMRHIYFLTLSYCLHQLTGSLLCVIHSFDLGLTICPQMKLYSFYWRQDFNWQFY